MGELNLTREQIEELVKLAEQNNGHCDKCHRVLNIYRYNANKVMARILRAMASATQDGGRAIDVDKIGLRHSERTQLTKMRFHGLVAKVKENGVQVPRHWVITNKGWKWLKGEPIQQKVLVYNNAVLGHEGEFITIKQALGESVIEKQPIATEEAGVYGQAREGVRGLMVTAVYKGMTAGSLVKGKTYELKIARLKMGQAVKIIEPFEHEYADIGRFSSQWQVIKKGEVQ
jgi:stress response protein YsnF